jgi:glycosyltransferase involved in cell wall biosynthesis
MFARHGQDLGYLLFFAKLAPLKGIYPLIEACRKASEVKVKVAGRVEDERVKKLLETLPGNVEYLGMQQGEPLQELICNARAVVLPSLWYENQPFSITEAFAAEKPVVVSDLGGMTELVKHGERGLLVPPGNVESLADAMTWMAEHPQEAQKMGQRARKYALQAHSAHAHYKKLMHLYGQVVREAREV